MTRCIMDQGGWGVPPPSDDPNQQWSGGMWVDSMSNAAGQEARIAARMAQERRKPGLVEELADEEA
jgi:hypothetical protein